MTRYPNSGWRGRACATVAAALLLAGCETAQSETVAATPEAGFSAAETAGSAAPSPATIAMRWQWLNPEVNAFTFRNAHEVFAWRAVEAPQEAWTLAEGPPLPLPEGYEEWAEASFTNAMLVLRDGAVVFEDYRNRMTPETPHVAFSMSKTITAMLVGQALERGEIASLDDPVSQYVPELADGAYGAATLRNVMEMRSGADIEERYDFGENPSLAAQIHETAIIRNEARFADFAVGIGSRAEPGSVFNYATLDTGVLGWVLENATGQRIEDLMEQRIWQPMGAGRDAFWLADGEVGTDLGEGGRALSGMGFNATLRDFARLGQLMLDDGMADGTRILPAGWVAQMSAMKPTGIPVRPGYGLQTWQVDEEPGAFAAVGLAGQYIYVHPESRTVIVKLSHYPPVPPAGLDGDVADFFGQIANTPLAEGEAP